jgi:nitronate monooxygenase
MASGQVVGVIDDLPTCQELIDRIVTQADAVLDDLNVKQEQGGEDGHV